jgi:hypothetical protein
MSSIIPESSGAVPRNVRQDLLDLFLCALALGPDSHALSFLAGFEGSGLPHDPLGSQGARIFVYLGCLQKNDFLVANAPDLFVVLLISARGDEFIIAPTLLLDIGGVYAENGLMPHIHILAMELSV